MATFLHPAGNGIHLKMTWDEAGENLIELDIRVFDRAYKIQLYSTVVHVVLPSIYCQLPPPLPRVFKSS
jgi:hypothetical protein